MTAAITALLLLAGHVATTEPALRAAATASPDSAGIRGRITDVRTGEPVAAATVELSGPSTSRTVVSDRRGEYVLYAVSPGVHLMRVLHPGYAPSTISLTVGAGSRLVLDLPLDVAPIQLEPIIARATRGEEAAEPVDASTAGHGTATTYLVTSAPAALSLASAGQRDHDPGTGGPGDVFLVRGFTADLKRTLLDGAPIHTSFHMGGLMEPLVPNVVQAVTVHSGGAPASYDGGLTWVMDVRTRDPDRGRFHGELAADWLTAQGHVEGSLGDAADLLLSARTTLGGPAEAMLGRSLGYDYHEGLVRTRTDLGGDATLRLTGFVNEESVTLPPRSAPARWGANLLSARVETPRFTTGVAYSEGHLRLPAATDGAVAVDANLRQAHLSLQGRVPGPRIAATYGLEADAYDFTRSGADQASARDEGARYAMTGAYGDVAWQIEPRVRLRGGLRLNHFSPTDDVRASPRLALSWLVAERAMLTVSAGRFSQYVRVQDGAFRGALTPRFGDALGGQAIEPAIEAARSEMVVQEATHVALSLDQQLSDHTRLELQGFVKDYAGIPAIDGARLQASGIDVWVGSRGTTFSGWFGYSLSWVWSRDDALPPATAVADDRFAARQILAVGVSGRSAALGTIALNASYGSGLPLTSIELERTPLRDALVFETASVRNVAGQGQDPTATPDAERFLRIDVEASRTFELGTGARTTTLTPYVRLLNALDRRDAIFFHRDASDDAVRPLATVPILPLVGLKFRW